MRPFLPSALRGPAAARPGARASVRLGVVARAALATAAVAACGSSETPPPMPAADTAVTAPATPAPKLEYGVAGHVWRAVGYAGAGVRTSGPTSGAVAVLYRLDGREMPRDLRVAGVEVVRGRVDRAAKPAKARKGKAATRSDSGGANGMRRELARLKGGGDIGGVGGAGGSWGASGSSAGGRAGRRASAGTLPALEVREAADRRSLTVIDRRGAWEVGTEVTVVVHLVLPDGSALAVPGRATFVRAETVGPR